jgi:ribosomal 50S subunit-recycling heat shock protein
MNEITQASDLKIGDEIVVDFPPNYEQGRILTKESDCVVANMSSSQYATAEVRKVKPDQIISLRRGKDYFKVSIK